MFRIYLLFLFFILGCNYSEKKKPPENIIPEKQLIPILVDIHFADATLSVLHFDKKNARYKPENYYNIVLKKHGIDRKKFDESIEYYSKNPEELDIIYDKVLNEFSKLKANLTKSDTSTRSSTPKYRSWHNHKRINKFEAKAEAKDSITNNND